MNFPAFMRDLQFIHDLFSKEEWKDNECKEKVYTALDEAQAKIQDAFGYSMNYQWFHKPTVEAVEKVVCQFPSTLSYEIDEGTLPIHHAANPEFYSDTKYVPILAREGIKYNVGGEDTRGGLLVRDDHSRLNVLQSLTYHSPERDDEQKVTESVEIGLNALEELRKEGLFLKADIQQYALLHTSSETNVNMEIFDYLLKWDADALIAGPLIHNICYAYEDGYCYDPRIALAHVLKAGFCSYPNIGGLLFTKNAKGETALDRLFDCEIAEDVDCKISKEDIMTMLHKILFPKSEYPILHHICTKAPEHREIFMQKFPWAYHLKDHNGRTLKQAILAAGPKVVNADPFLLAFMTDDELQQKDPVTTLYPFAAMAVGDDADLQNCFYLLRRCPAVFEDRQD